MKLLFLFLPLFSIRQSTYDGPELQRLKTDTAYARKYKEQWDKFISDHNLNYTPSKQDTVPKIYSTAKWKASSYDRIFDRQDSLTLDKWSHGNIRMSGDTLYYSPHPLIRIHSSNWICNVPIGFIRTDIDGWMELWTEEDWKEHTKSWNK